MPMPMNDNVNPQNSVHNFISLLDILSCSYEDVNKCKI
jgi:hypothetical protein